METTMPRPRKKTENTDLLSEVTSNKDEHEEQRELELHEMPLNSLGDYVRYNRKARALNKSLGICRYHVQQCPIELHPKQRVVFMRKDQPANPLPVYVSNEMIEFKQKLIPGREYDLPLTIIDYLASKGVPIWDWVDNPDGSRETRKVAMDPRFALRTVYKDY